MFQVSTIFGVAQMLLICILIAASKGGNAHTAFRRDNNNLRDLATLMLTGRVDFKKYEFESYSGNMQHIDTK